MSTTPPEVLKLLSAEPPKKDIAPQTTNAKSTPVATAAPTTATPTTAPTTKPAAAVLTAAAVAASGQTVLAQQPAPAEHIQASLDKILNTQKKVPHIHALLGRIIDTVAKDQSILDRASSSYGSLPLWQKITVGVGVAVPTLVAGILTNVGALVYVSGTTILAYTSAGYVLDEHHQSRINSTKDIKVVMCNLADVLQEITDDLDKIRKDLKSEVAKFTLENINLKNNVEDLRKQLNILGPQVGTLKAAHSILQKSKDRLEATILSLDSSIDEQNKLLKQNQEELAKVTKEYDASQKQLAEIIAKFDTAKTSMAKEIDKAKKIATTLQGTLVTLTGSVIADPKQQQVFQQKLDHFLTDKEVSFKSISTGFVDTEKELASTKEQLIASNKLYVELLSRYEEQVKRLEAEAVLADERAKTIQPGVKLSRPLGAMGIFPGQQDKTLSPSLPGSKPHSEPTNSVAAAVAVVG